MPSKIADLVRTVVADKKITKAEWDEQLKGAVANPKRATPETRELLQVWANDGFEADAGVRADMRNVLTSAGYDIPYNLTPKADVIPGLIESNMTEVDSDFASLLEKTGKGANRTTIAVLDGGFQIDHPAYADKEWTNAGEVADNGVDDDQNGLVDDVHGWDFAGNDKDVSGGDHGTHVSGTATRGTDRIQEIACRVFDPLDPAKVADAIDYACKNGARVINMSFKVDEENEVTLVKAAMERHPDVLFVKSAGNDGNRLSEGKSYGGYYDDGKEYGEKTYLPMATIPNMVVVAAADAKGEVAEYSNRGTPWVTVGMRGSEVYSSVPGGQYRSMDGTSMASPNVTAVIAKCLTLAPKLTPADVRQLLIDTTDKRDDWKDVCISGGLVNQGRATRLAALLDLTLDGKVKPEDAATQLGLEGEERTRLLELATHYPVAAPATTTPATTTPATTTPAATTPVATTPVTPPSPATVTPR